MNIYLMPGLTRAQKNQLKEAGIEYAAWDENTVSVEEGVLTEALHVLHAQATETATEFEGVVQLELRFVTNAMANAPATRELTAVQQQSRVNYIAACSERIGQELKAAQEVIQTSRRELPPQAQQFVAARRSLLFSKSDLLPETLVSAFQAELAEMREVAKVADVRVVPGAILVNTDKLFATDRDTGCEHELGKFLIVIHTDGRKNGVRWFNGSRRVEGVRPEMNAPNVYDDGTACADELLSTFFELIARLEFAALVDLAIQFVEEVTDDDLAKSISNWPKAK